MSSQSWILMFFVYLVYMTTHFSKGKILYIDHTESMLEVVSRFLIPKGYEVLTALGLETGLEAIERVDCDLLMIDMSVGARDGVYPILDRMIDMKPGVPIVFYTSSLPSDIEKYSF